MPLNGSGAYTPPPASFPAVANTVIEAAKFNNVINDIASALSLALYRDGQAAMTGPSNFGGQNLLALGQSRAGNGTAALPSYAFTNDVTSGLYLDSAGRVALASNGVRALRGLQASEGGGVEVAAQNGGQLAGLRNKVINGKMEIAQRGSSFPAAANGTFPVDRFAYQFAGTTAVVTASQQADAPSSNEFQNSLRITVTTADATVAAGDVALIEQRIEGFNARDFIGRAFTLSFWVRSSKTGTHCVAFRNGPAADRSYVLTYTVTAANTWEFKQVTVPVGLITAGTWNWTNGAGLMVCWVLMSGSTFQTTSDAWQTGSFVATSAQVNCMDTIGNIFAITGVQIEIGRTSTPFEHRNFGLETLFCQRYYHGGVIGGNAGSPVNASYAGAISAFACEMRGLPIISWADLAANPNAFTTSNGNGFFYTVGSVVAATTRFAVADGVLNAAPGNWFRAVYTANAEL